MVFLFRLHGRDSNSSGATIAYGDFAILVNKGDFPFALGKPEHFLHPCAIFLDINVFMVFKGLPGPFCIGSARFTIDNYLFFHDLLLFLAIVFEARAASPRDWQT